MLDFVLENEERMSKPKKRVTFKLTNKLQNSIKKIRKTLVRKQRVKNYQKVLLKNQGLFLKKVRKQKKESQEERNK